MSEKGAEALRAWREAGGERSERKSPIEKHLAKPTSLRLAVNAKCWDCSNEQMAEIRHCTVMTCPLWHVRPYK